ncbi:MAG: hypothetical protein ACTSW4_07915 [Candidatus Ranarchaeia archaeon]
MTGPNFDPLKKQKEKTNILILGVYHPHQCIIHLKKLKKHLISQGFPNTCLVRDFGDDSLFHPSSANIHFQRKSFFYMEHWANVLLFIIHKGCNPMGVLREFARMIEHDPYKTQTAALFCSETISLSSLIKADIELHDIRAYSYSSQKDLNELAYAACFSIMDLLRK